MEHDFAPIRLRIAAAVIDVVYICVCVVLPTLFLVGIFYILGFLYLHLWNESVVGYGFTLGLFLLMIGVISQFPHTGFREGDLSYGKKMMGISVVNLDGSATKTHALFVRNIGRVISLLCFGIGFWTLNKWPSKQALYDVWAGTVVVMNKSKKAT